MPDPEEFFESLSPRVFQGREFWVSIEKTDNVFFLETSDFGTQSPLSDMG